MPSKEQDQLDLSSGTNAAQFPNLEQGPKAKVPARDLDFLLDIPLEVSVELGHTTMLINDLLQLGQGSVIELSKLAGEPLEILVNSRLIARGEAVVINEKFGVRITDIISPLERVNQLS
jgi:flagellar motor switch protein FliN